VLSRACAAQIGRLAHNLEAMEAEKALTEERAASTSAMVRAVREHSQQQLSAAMEAARRERAELIARTIRSLHSLRNHMAHTLGGLRQRAPPFTAVDQDGSGARNRQSAPSSARRERQSELTAREEALRKIDRRLDGALEVAQRAALGSTRRAAQLPVVCPDAPIFAPDKATVPPSIKHHNRQLRKSHEQRAAHEQRDALVDLPSLHPIQRPSAALPSGALWHSATRRPIPPPGDQPSVHSPRNLSPRNLSPNNTSPRSTSPALSPRSYSPHTRSPRPTSPKLSGGKPLAGLAGA
jgi:hypothetical protein